MRSERGCASARSLSLSLLTLKLAEILHRSRAEGIDDHHELRALKDELHAKAVVGVQVDEIGELVLALE
jgi:hypothetical protein